MKISYSQYSIFQRCSRFWFNSYVLKYQGKEEGASLAFGSAIDAAVMDLLNGKPDWTDKFYQRWKTQVTNNKFIDVFDNPNIVYAYGDFDPDILDDKDLNYLNAWIKELNLDSSLGTNGIEVYKEIAKIKKNPYKTIKPEELKYFNRASWLSLNKKGKLLLEAFHTQFYPKIKKVLAVQKSCSLKDETTGDSIQGFIDCVLEIEGQEKCVIFDLKTSSSPYEESQVKLSDQLLLYGAMKFGEFNTDKVGYIVLCKNIPKETVATCSKCGYTRDGRHKTCNNVINNNRCEGSWIETKVPKPSVQVLIETKNMKQIDNLLGDMSNVAVSMKNNLVSRNTSACENWYGSRCTFYDGCHKNDWSSLKKKGE